MAKRAVLIGVNRYRIPGADLRGCVPDVKNMSSLLQRKYGFDAGDISMLTDFDATKKAIEEAITGLISGGQSGDVLLVHFSGHGSNVPDDNGDEADNRDEILCPTDLDWYDPLRDDWLRSVFDGLRDGVSLTVITDSCHSGTVTRAIEPPDAPLIERYLPSPWDLAAVESGRSLTGTTRGTLRQRAGVRAQRSRHRSRRHPRGAHLGLPGRPDFGRCGHRRRFRRSADVQPGRGAHRIRGTALLPRAARPDLRQAETRPLRTDSATRRQRGAPRSTLPVATRIAAGTRSGGPP